MTKPFFTVCGWMLLACLAGCASQVKHGPAAFAPVVNSVNQTLKTMAQSADVALDTGYNRSLKAGSQWIQVGTISQGDVYKSYKDVFTLEGAHIHEAYLVISEGQLVGFYLPVERGFSPLAQKVQLNFN